MAQNKKGEKYAYLCRLCMCAGAPGRNMMLNLCVEKVLYNIVTLAALLSVMQKVDRRTDRPIFITNGRTSRSKPRRIWRQFEWNNAQWITACEVVNQWDSMSTGRMTDDS